MESTDKNHDIVEDIAQTNENNSEIEDKVAQILRLLKNNGQDNIEGKIPDDSSEETEAMELILELQNEYNKLYSQYDNVRGEIKKKVQSKREKENSSSHSNSDFENYSPDELENGDKMDLELVCKRKEIEATQLSEMNLKLSGRISELQIMLTEKENEISNLTLKMSENEKDLNWRIETLTKQVNKESALAKALKDEAKSMLEEITRRTNSERNLLKEKDGFLAQIEGLKLEVNSLHDHKNELEETIRGKEHEVEKLSQENDRVKTRVQELETKSEEGENEVSTRTIALKEQVNNLQQELDSAQSEKRELKTNSTQNLTELDGEEQNKNVKDKDDPKLHKTHSLDIQKLRVAESPRTSTRVLNHHTLERKIVDHADKFQMNVENQMRLLAQRIRVAEQIQTESKESYKKIVENLEQENKELNGRNLFYEAELKKITEMFSESGNSLLLELDSMVKRIDKEDEKFVNKISRISREIQIARNWIRGENCGIKNMKDNVESFLSKKDETEEHSPDLTLKRKLEEVEKKLSERDEVMSIIGEEKREVIRQLCYQIDYHRLRYRELKQKVSNMSL